MPPRHLHRFPQQPVLIGAIRRDDGRVLHEHPEPIRDSIRFCARILDDTMDNWGMHLELEEYEDTLSELLIIALRLEKTYDPTRSPSFAGYARNILERRAVDAGPRRILGRTGSRLAERCHDELDEESIARARTRTPEPGEAGDTPDHRRDSQGRLVRDGDRPSAGSYAILGLGTLVGVKARDARPDRDPQAAQPGRARIAA